MKRNLLPLIFVITFVIVGYLAFNKDANTEIKKVVDTNISSYDLAKKNLKITPLGEDRVFTMVHFYVIEFEGHKYLYNSSGGMCPLTEDIK